MRQRYDLIQGKETLENMLSEEPDRPNQSSYSLDILLPFYGDPRLLHEAVASVLAQTDDDWRLIVVDDGYPDPGVAKWFSTQDDPRILYQRNSHNLGANKNYTRALELANADLVTILGADDRLLPNYVSKSKETFHASPGTVSMYQPGVQVIDERGLPVRPLGDRVKERLRPAGGATARVGGEALAASLLRGNWTYFPSICWRREPLQRLGFRPYYHVLQDLALILDMVADGQEMIIGHAITFEYRRHVGSDSAVKTLSGQRFEEERALYAEAETRFANLGWNEAARAARRHLTSRMNALVALPTALRWRQWEAVPRLLAHALDR